MSKTYIAILFILIGLAYGSMAIDAIYNSTLGWLAKNDWIKPPPEEKGKDGLKNLLGRKTTIIFYSAIFIIIGLYLLWNRDL